MQRLRNRLTFANVAAFSALFIVLGGGAYAAGTINGKNIINHTITGQDIKKGSIPLTALKKIPEGKAGPAGPAGAPGSALAYAHVNADGTLDSANSKNIAATKLTAGTGYYCVSPSVPVKNISATPADTIVGRQIVASFEDPFTSCPDGAAVVQAFDKAGVASKGAFYISFN